MDEFWNKVSFISSEVKFCQNLLGAVSVDALLMRETLIYASNVEGSSASNA